MADGVKVKDILWAVICFLFNVLMVLMVISIISIIPKEEWVMANCPKWLTVIFDVVRKITLAIWKFISLS